MELTAMLRREGRIVPHDIPLAVSYYGTLAEFDPRFNKGLVDALLCSDDRSDWERAFRICSEDGGDWTWDFLARMHFEGVGTPRDAYEAARIVEEHNLFPDRIRCALRIRPELHGRRNLVLAGSPEEVDVLLLRCMEDNVKPDFWWCPGGGSPRHASVLDEVISGTDDPAALPGAVVLCETPVRAPGIPVYSVSGGEPLLVPDRGLEPANTCFVYTDGYLDGESRRFMGSAAVFNATEGTGAFKRFMEAGGSAMDVVVAADVETIRSVIEKAPNGRLRICTGAYSKRLEFLSLEKLIYRAPLVIICLKYVLGRHVCERIGEDTDKRVVAINQKPMGDIYRDLSRRKSYQGEAPAVIITKRGRELPDLAALDGYYLTDVQHESLLTYVSMASKYQDTIFLINHQALFPGLNRRVGLQVEPVCLYGLSRRFSFLWRSYEINGTGATSMLRDRLPVAERFSEIPFRSILINPYGNYIQRYPELTEPYRLLFDTVSRKLASIGYTVYTNAPFDNQALLPESRRLDMSMRQLIPAIESFDFVITTFTGFMEAVMPTGVNLVVVCPCNESRNSMAFECRRTNYWEYTVSEDTDTLAVEICDLVASTPPACSPLSENRPEPSRTKTLDYSEDLISAADAIIWSEEAVRLAYNDSVNCVTMEETCASHPESPFAAYCEGRRLMKERSWSEAAGKLMRAHQFGCTAARDHLYKALWETRTREAHTVLLDMTADDEGPLAEGYRGLLFLRGTGVEQDLAKAAEWLRRAAG